MTGAVALLRARWPTLSAATISSILLDTATDLGTAGTDAIYGRGLLNLTKAMEAQGAAAVQTASGTSVSLGNATLLGQATLTLPAALGDAGSQLGAAHGFTFTDGYGRDFTFGFQGRLRATAQPLSIAAALQTPLAGSARGQSQRHGAGELHRAAKRAWQPGASRLSAMLLGVNSVVAGVTLDARYLRGRQLWQGSQALSLAPVQLEGWALRASGRLAARQWSLGQWSLGVSQPLRGTRSLTGPDARVIALAPTGHERRIEAGLAQRFGPWNLQATSITSFNANHTKSARDDAAWLKLTRQW
jgi:hypothetical protein